jgi:hypothetical protein
MIKRLKEVEELPYATALGNTKPCEDILVEYTVLDSKRVENLELNKRLLRQKLKRMALSLG